MTSVPQGQSGELRILHWKLWPPRVFDGSEPSEARSVVFAKLQAASASVWIGSTHLPRSAADARADAAQRLTAIGWELDGQWLLVGDFKMPAASWLDEYPSLRAYPEPPEPTYPIKDAVEPIDYCIAPQELRIQAQALPEKAQTICRYLCGAPPPRAEGTVTDSASATPWQGHYTHV